MTRFWQQPCQIFPKCRAHSRKSTQRIIPPRHPAIGPGKNHKLVAQDATRGENSHEIPNNGPSSAACWQSHFCTHADSAPRVVESLILQPYHTDLCIYRLSILIITPRSCCPSIPRSIPLTHASPHGHKHMHRRTADP